MVAINLAWPRPDVYGKKHWYFQYGAFGFVGIIVLLGGLYYAVTQRGRTPEVLAEHRAQVVRP